MDEKSVRESYQKLEECRHLIPAFKEFYYAEKGRDFRQPIKDIIQRFNEVQGEVFRPYPSAYQKWQLSWDRDILNKASVESGLVSVDTSPEQLIRSRDDDQKIIFGAPKDEDLEAGTRTLAGELTNDALQMLQDDQALQEIYTSDELMKRRSYIVNVLSHVTKMVHGKAALALKASQEKRENASFLMNLLAKASAGKMSEEEMALLEASHPPYRNEQSAQL